MPDLPDIAKVVQSSPLVQRLDRRRTEPVGVVDVRPFQSQYAHIPGWLVQRTALLSQLQTRYGGQDSIASEEADLILAVPGQQVSGNPPFGNDDRGGGNLPNQPVGKPPGSPIGSAPVLPGSPEPSANAGVFRVSRKAVLPESGSGQESGTNPLSMQSGSFTETRRDSPAEVSREVSRERPDILKVSEHATSPETSLSTVAESLPLQTKSTPSKSSSSSPPTQQVGEQLIQSTQPGVQRIVRSPGTPRPVEQKYNFPAEVLPSVPAPSILPASETALTLQTKAETPALVPLLHQSGNTTTSISDSLSVVQQTTENSIEGTGASESLILPKRQFSTQFSTATQTGEAAESLILPKRELSASSQTDQQPAIARSTNSVTPRTGTPSTATLEGTTQPLILRRGVPVASTQIQKLDNATPGLPVARQQSNGAASSSENRLVTASELSSSPSRPLQTQMVWRKSAGSTSQRNDSSPLSNSAASSNGLGITRQTDSSRIMLANGEGSSGSEAAIAPPSRSGGVNIAQLAEQVSRILARRLTVERERRGINQW